MSEQTDEQTDALLSALARNVPPGKQGLLAKRMDESCRLQVNAQNMNTAR